MKHLLLTSLSIFAACGSDPVKQPVDGPPSAPQDSSGSGSGSGSGSAGSDAPAEVLMAPYLETLKPGVPGPSLVVTWTNMTPDCDGVEVWRKDALNAYAVIATPAGTATSYEDPTATQNINYTFRLRCKKGAAFSDYSFEESANPHG